VSRFLVRAHEADEAYTVRDGINIARYALKRMSLAETSAGALRSRDERLAESVRVILGDEALRYVASEDVPPAGPRRT
jgi:hypothetical protein